MNWPWKRKTAPPQEPTLTPTADLEALLDEVCAEAPIRHGDPFESAPVAREIGGAEWLFINGVEICGACRALYRADADACPECGRFNPSRAGRHTLIYARLEPHGA